MNIITTIKKYWHKCQAWLIQKMQEGHSAQKLATTIAIGTFIAFCPFIGFHTILTFIAAWLFKLNLPILFIISCGINNPWTMIPIYLADHAVGKYLLTWCFQDALLYNPAWLSYINNSLRSMGLHEFSLWAFVYGGTFLASIVAIVIYGISLLLLVRLYKSK